MRKVTVNWVSSFRKLTRLNRGIKMKFNFEHGRHFLSIVYILCSIPTLIWPGGILHMDHMDHMVSNDRRVYSGAISERTYNRSLECLNIAYIIHALCIMISSYTIDIRSIYLMIKPSSVSEAFPHGKLHFRNDRSRFELRRIKRHGMLEFPSEPIADSWPELSPGDTSSTRSYEMSPY